MTILDQLKAEHREAEALLETLAESDPGEKRRQALHELTEALTIHMIVEERFVYPLVKEVVGQEDEEGAENEHQLARDGLDKMHQLVDKPGFGAAVEMVKAGIGHHVEEEESEIFPQLEREAGDEIAALGDPDDLKARARSDSSETKADLYAKARAADIEGRSQMSKEELRQAVAASKG